MKEQILFYAFRYALGRKTYAVLDVAEAILHCAKEISPRVRVLILKELDTASKENRLGAQCDQDTWQKVRVKLNELQM